MLFQKRLYAFVRPSITQYSGINRVTFHILPFCVCDSWEKNTNLPTMRQSSMGAVKTIEESSYTAGYLYILYTNNCPCHITIKGPYDEEIDR